MKVDIYDPWVDYSYLKNIFDFNFVKKIKKKYEVLILAVGHDIFKKFTPKKIKNIVKNNNVIFDIKSFLNKEIVSDRL